MRFLFSALIFFAATGCAAADPTGGALTYAVVSFLAVEGGLGVAAAAAITPYLFAAVVVGAAAGLQYLTATRPSGPAAIDPGRMKETFETSDAPEIRAVGRVRVGGTKIFGDTSGANRYRLIAQCKGPIDGVEAYFLGGREIVVEGDGAVSSPPWPVRGGSYAYLSSKLGDGNETAWPQLLSGFASLWSSAHRVRGIAQTLAQFTSPGFTSPKFLQLYQNGVPDVEALLRAENTVYDPYTGLSGWSENGICNVLHILRSYPELADLAIYDTAFLAAEAARADVATLRQSGASTARARACGFWSSENQRGDTMQQALDSIGAIIVQRPGNVVDGIQEIKLGIQLLDDAPAAELTLSVRNLVDLKWSSGPQGVERPNICRCKYYSPERNYELAEIDFTGLAWPRIEDEIAAYGEKPYDVPLPFCPDAGQAQQIARRKFAMARGDTGLATYNFAGMAAWGCRVIAIELPDDGGTLLCYKGALRVLDAQFQVEIPFIVCPALAPWNPAVDEAAAPAQLPDFQADSVLTQPGAPGDAYLIYAAGGTVARSGIDYQIPADGAQVEAVYRVYSGAQPGTWQSMSESGAPGGSGSAETATDLLGLTCDFRIRTFDAGGDNASYWSALFHVTVTAAIAYADLAVPVLVVDAGTGNLVATAPVDAAVAFIKARFNGGAWSSHAVASGGTVTIAAAVAGVLPAGLYEAQTFPASGYGGFGSRTAAFTAP